MNFAEFLSLSPQNVKQLLDNNAGDALGIAMPFNGTRRWYLTTYNKNPEAILTTDYVLRTTRRIWEVAGMVFADGVTTLYSPIIGRALLERGAEYMTFIAQSLEWLVDDGSLKWYRENNVAASFYGEIELLPSSIVERLIQAQRESHTPTAQHYLRWGIFADNPVTNIIARTIRLTTALGTPPTEQQLISDYYSGPPTPVGMWIGTEQPTIYDVPLVTHGHTALYFLQFPTLSLDLKHWRRLLYDYLFVRGGEEALQPENVSDGRQILGLGVRHDGCWVASTT